MAVGVGLFGLVRSGPVGYEIAFPREEWYNLIRTTGEVLRRKRQQERYSLGLLFTARPDLGSDRASGFNWVVSVKGEHCGELWECGSPAHAPATAPSG